MKTKLILSVDDATLGHTGDVVEVASGYARNYLVPRGLALPYSDDAIRRLEKHRVAAEKVRIEQLSDMQSLADKLASLELSFTEKVSSAGHLYGAVTAKRISEALGEQGVDISESNVRLGEPIRVVGEFEVPIHVHSDLNAAVKVWVVGEEVADPEVEETPELDEDGESSEA
ncbi:MAG: 50S ribosomal protein L9 [Planctomycetes bacterium]|nr:50S ribosomal protein L9 [Planctomycetota bacterium]